MEEGGFLAVARDVEVDDEGEVVAWGGVVGSGDSGGFEDDWFGWHGLV